MGKRHLVSQPAPPGAPSSSTNHLFCPSLGGGLAVCRICPPDPTVKEQPGQAADVWHQGHPGAHRRSPALPHMCDPWCLGKAEAREQPFPVCWAVALAGRRTGGRTGGTEKQLSPVRGPREAICAAQGQGGGGGRASPRLTSLRNKGAFLHASLGRVCLPDCCHRRESAGLC